MHEGNPHPTTELHYKSHFELLIAVMLSAQATDISVNKVTPRLFTKANSPPKMVELGEKNIKKIINSIGLYNTKAANIIKTCRILAAFHKGQVPRTRSALEELPGVGRKTANVILNTAFHRKTIAVDTHIFRVANRTGLAPGKTVREVEQKLMEVVPAQYMKNAHHWLLLHGRYICKARRPHCQRCPIEKICAWPHKNSTLETSGRTA